MKKILSVILVSMFAAGVMAVSVADVAGVYSGTLTIGSANNAGVEVYVLPGVAHNSVTIVIPNGTSGTSLGEMVLTDVEMSTSGSLSMSGRSVYLAKRAERAVVSVTASSLSKQSAQFTLSVSTPTVSSLTVRFNGNRVTDRNYAITNGGFEGTWSNGEVNGWHSFGTATGSFASFVKNNAPFEQSSDVRAGVTGHSAKIYSKNVLSKKANGNCTNGQINAGSTSAGDASKNYNFSDPSNSGYNTPFAGNPDSLVFWAKYIPGGGSVTDESNKARAHAVITTNARYQDPETGSSASVRIADATINYKATSSKGWQRLSVPFVYTQLDRNSVAYMLITFSTNETPGGGNSSGDSPDQVYLDDVEMVYNHALQSLKMNGKNISFVGGKATTDEVFSESDYTFSATTNGIGAKTVIGYDAETSCVYIYVLANNYVQGGGYSVYTLQMAEPVHNTAYHYSATICAGEPYSDELFSDLKESGDYVKTIPNMQGGDSVITLTLEVLPTYSFPEEVSIRMNESYSWRGKEFRDLVPGTYSDEVALKTQKGCDSVYTLTLTVLPISYEFTEEMTACHGEEGTWRGKVLPTEGAGEKYVYDSLKSVYGTDSVYVLLLTVLPDYSFTEMLRVNSIDTTWRGQTIKALEARQEPYLFYDSLKTVFGCDSVYELKVFVSALPITYGAYEALVCEGDQVEYEGVIYTEAFSGEVHLLGMNIYGGDSIVRLTVKVLPNYLVEQEMTITEGDNESWEGWNLSGMPVGESELYASYYSIDDCDSTIVLHLTVLAPQPIEEGLDDAQEEVHRGARKVMMRDRIYIIREDESEYTILGTKIK